MEVKTPALRGLECLSFTAEFD